MRVHEVMTSPVVTVTSHGAIRDAVAILLTRGFTALPVLDNGELVGIVTEQDLLTSDGSRTIPDRPGADNSPSVASVMRTSVVTVNADDETASAVALMSDRHLRSVPVIRQGRLVGILTRRDLLRAQTSDIAGQVFTDNSERLRWTAAVQGGYLDMDDFAGGH